MSSLLGIWIFSAVIYQGHLMDPPNPNLHLYYSFLSETRNEIYYYRDDEKGACKRWADYSASKQTIEQTVVEVDPLNVDSCSNDSDMLMNSHSIVKYEMTNDQLHLYLPLGEEEIVYIFSRTQYLFDSCWSFFRIMDYPRIEFIELNPISSKKWTTNEDQKLSLCLKHYS